MDLAMYMIIATFVVFFVGATFALAASITGGFWRDLDSAALIVLAEDDPYPDAPAETAPRDAEASTPEGA